MAEPGDTCIGLRLSWSYLCVPLHLRTGTSRTTGQQSTGTRWTRAITEIEALVPSALAGDPDGLQRLICLVRPFVLRWCHAKVCTMAGRASAEDVAQEVCLAVVGAIERYRPGGGPFMAWVAAITSNKAADAYRRHYRDRSTTAGDVPDVVDPAETAEASVLRGETASELRVLLDTLSETHQAVLILRIVERMSAEETGRLLGMTAGNVRVAQHRALQRLRRLVADTSGDRPR